MAFEFDVRAFAEMMESLPSADPRGAAVVKCEDLLLLGKAVMSLRKVTAVHRAYLENVLGRELAAPLLEREGVLEAEALLRRIDEGG